MRVASDEAKVLREDLKHFGEVETVGYFEENTFYKFEQNIVHNRTRYVTKLSFKPEPNDLPDNCNVSKIHLKNLTKRLTI